MRVTELNEPLSLKSIELSLKRKGPTNPMHREFPQQSREHAITTMYTCRGILKYNASLTSEQKEELLADIDASLRFLQEDMAHSASSSLPPASSSPTPLSIRLSPTPHADWTPHPSHSPHKTGAGQYSEP